MNKKLKLLLYSLSFFIVICFSSLDFIKKENYKNEEYYKQTIEQIKKVHFNNQLQEEFSVGWSKVNITPSKSMRLAGYGWIRDEFTKVRDSIFVRSILISQKEKNYVIISYDLMLASKKLEEELESRKKELGVDGIYISATHTHNSFGGWDNSLFGSISVGWFDQEIVYKLVEKTVECIKKSKKKLSLGKINYKEIETENLVMNKFSSNAHTDRKIRCIEFKTANKTAILCSFSAHANITPYTSFELSNDYPGFLIQHLEESPKYDFALFCAGAVGLHKGDFSLIKKTYEGVKQYGIELAKKILNDNSANWEDSVIINYYQHPVLLPRPTFKLSNCIRLRPYFFEKLSNKKNICEITQLNLNKVRLIGTPSDFSGELYKTINHQNNTLITSFNGDYIGYIIPDNYYNRTTYEARELNWYGSNTGSYFVEMINEIIVK